MSNIGRPIRYPTLGDIPPEVIGEHRRLLEDMIMLLDLAYGRQGKGTNARFVTIADLVAAGVVADGVIK